MTRFSDLQARHAECAVSRDIYWAAVRQKVAEIAEGFVAYLQPDPDFFVRRDGTQCKYVVAGMVEHGQFRKATLDELVIDGRCLRLAFELSFPGHEAASIDTVLLEMRVGKQGGKFFALVDSDHMSLRVDISDCGSTSYSLDVLYANLSSEATRQINELKFD